MLGFPPQLGIPLPVERIGKSHPQVYPQGRLFFTQSTSWMDSNPVPISGGQADWTNPIISGLLHRVTYLSTDYRDLSTAGAFKIGGWGLTLPLNAGVVLSDYYTLFSFSSLLGLLVDKYGRE
jgi:hypothetical protein